MKLNLNAPLQFLSLLHKIDDQIIHRFKMELLKYH